MLPIATCTSHADTASIVIKCEHLYICLVSYVCVHVHVCLYVHVCGGLGIRH